MWICIHLSRVYIEEDGRVTRKLYVTNITDYDAGEYTCRASVRGALLDKSVRLLIFSKKNFVDLDCSYFSYCCVNIQIQQNIGPAAKEPLEL